MESTKHKGLYYRLDKHKRKVWIARIFINNKPFKRVIGKEPGMNITLAIKARLDLEEELRTGKATKVNKKSLDTLFQEYLELRKTTISKSWYSNNVLNWNKYINGTVGHLLPQDVNVANIQKIVNRMLDDGKAPATAKQIKEIITGLYKYLPSLGIDDIDNIGYKVKLPKFDNSRNIELTDDEVHSLFNAIFEYKDIKIRTIFIWLLHGRRKGEVLNMRWENIDFNNSQYTIVPENSKIKKTLTFAVSTYLLNALKEYGIKDNGLIFPSNVKPNQIIGKTGMDYHWKNIRIETGLKNLNMHDLRHLVGGFGVNEGGFSLEKVGSALGHNSNSKATARYSKMKQDSAKAVIDSYMSAFVPKPSYKE